MAVCPACKAPVSKADRFCGACGHALADQAKTDPNLRPTMKQAGHSEPRPSLSLLLVIILVGTVASQLPIVIQYIVNDEMIWRWHIVHLTRVAGGFAACLLTVAAACGVAHAFRRTLSWRAAFHGTVAAFFVILVILLLQESHSELGLWGVLGAAIGLSGGYEALRAYQRGTARTRRLYLISASTLAVIAALITAIIAVGPDRLLAYLQDSSQHTFRGHTDVVSEIAFAPDGQTALSGSWDRALKLWDVASGEQIRTFRGHSWSVTSVAFSPDGRTAVSGSRDKTLRIWEVATGKETRAVRGHTGHVNAVAFVPDGRTVLSGSDDETLKLWDVASGALLASYVSHRGAVTSVAVSPDGRTALSGSTDDTLKLWDMAKVALIRTFDGHTHDVTSVVFLPGGRRALSGSRDGTLKLWDLAAGTELRTIVVPGRGTINDIAVSPDGRTALSAHGGNFRLRDYSVTHWNLQTGTLLETFVGHTLWVDAVSFAPDGRTALSGSSDETLKLWDVAR